MINSPLVLWRLVHPDDVESIKEKIVVSARDLTPFFAEYRTIDSGGNISWMRAGAKPCGDKQGNIIWDGLIIDITTEKNAQIALEYSEKKFQQITELSPNLTYIIIQTADNNFFFEYVSPQITEIHEVTIDDAYSNFNLILRNFHPEDIDNFLAEVDRCREMMEIFHFEWRIITPSGKIKWLQGFDRPEKRDNGDTAWYGITIDVTEKKKLQDDLQEKTDILEEFFNSTLDLLCIANLDGYFVKISALWSGMLGYHLEQLEGQKFLDFVHPDDIQMTIEAIEKLGKQEKVLNFVKLHCVLIDLFKKKKWFFFSKQKTAYELS